MKGFFLSFLILFHHQIFAQEIAHDWFNQEKNAKIRIYKGQDGKFYGKIIWLKEPLNTSGRPKTDEKNPDRKKQSQPILNLVILNGFTRVAGENAWENGTVYDPNNGKTYCGKLTPGNKTLILRGYICGLSWFGRNSVWTLAE